MNWRIPMRIRRAIHVLRGRPLAYRIKIHDGTMVVDEDHTWIHDCEFKHSSREAVRLTKEVLEQAREYHP